MKIRLDFVTNSSSSSFVAYSIHSKELADYIRSLVDQGKQISGDLKKGLFPKGGMGELRILGEDEVAMVFEAADRGLSLDNCMEYDSRNLRQKAADIGSGSVHPFFVIDKICLPFISNSP